MSLTESHAT